MPRLGANDPSSVAAMLRAYGTADTGIDPGEIPELLEQADEEIREAEYDLVGGFPNGGLKSAEMAILKMGLALALGYCHRLAEHNESDPRKGQRSHRNAALLVWFWARESMPRVEPLAAQLVDVIERRNAYSYRTHPASPSEALDATQAVKEVREALGDEPIRIYQSTMARLKAARRQP